MSSAPQDDQPEYFDPRTFTDRSGFPAPPDIRIYDATLRDGEQSPGLAFTPTQKLEIAEALSDIGVHIIDLGFPYSSASDAESLKLIVQAKRYGRLRDDLEFTVCCRANRQDIDACIVALEQIGCGPNEVTFTVLTSASDLHMRHKLGPMLLKREGRKADGLERLDRDFFRQANLRMIEDVITHSRERGIERVEFAAEDSSRAHIDFLLELVGTAVRAGSCRYGFADTTGSLTPESTRYYLDHLRQAFPELPVVTHFHNDFDLATINTLVGLSLGASVFSCTVNGIGERAGNAALHNVVVGMQLLYGVTVPGFRYDRLWGIKDLVERLSGTPTSVHEPIVGRNTFAHEAGIHVHGVLNNPLNYEPIPCDLVGGHRRLVFGKHSGSVLVQRLLEQNRLELERDGVELTGDLTGRVLTAIKQLREKRAEQGIAAEIVDRHRQDLARLEISEAEVLALTRELSATPVPVTVGS